MPGQTSTKQELNFKAPLLSGGINNIAQYQEDNQSFTK